MFVVGFGSAPSASASSLARASRLRSLAPAASDGEDEARGMRGEAVVALEFLQLIGFFEGFLNTCSTQLC